MERRDLVRSMVLAVFAAATTKLDLFAAEGGTLTCDLSQWKWLVFDYNGKRVAVTMDEVFPALEEYFGSAAKPTAVKR